MKKISIPDYIAGKKESLKEPHPYRLFSGMQFDNLKNMVDFDQSLNVQPQQRLSWPQKKKRLLP